MWQKCLNLPTIILLPPSRTLASNALSGPTIAIGPLIFVNKLKFLLFVSGIDKPAAGGFLNLRKVAFYFV